MKKEGDQEARARNRLVRRVVDDALGSLGGESIKSVIAAKKRRAAPQRAALENRALNLIREENGLLRWHIGTAPPPGPGQEVLTKRRGFRRAPLVAPLVLSQTLFEKQDPSKVSDLLVAADKRLSSPGWEKAEQPWGLRIFTKSGRLTPYETADLSKLTGKNVLLIIHGTFSNSDTLIAKLEKAPGPGLLSAALRNYDFVLTFDHPTLAQSPMLNAFELAAKFAHGPPGKLDVMAHGRGGLVARWFCEGFRQEPTRCRVIMVGAPLAGTSLVAPARIKAVMNYLSNAGEAIGLATGLGGDLLLAVAGSLAGFFARVTGALSTPLADAVVAMIPGLSSQSRQGSNSELRALRANIGQFDFADPASPVNYWVIRSSFEPLGSKVWDFMKSFVTRPGAASLGTAAQYVFRRANDLVVDLDSMNQTGESGQPQPAPSLITNVAHDFGASRTVHHCNYFEQRQTVQAVRKAFGF